LIGHITKDGNIAGPKILSTWLILFCNLKEIATTSTAFTITKKSFCLTAEIGIYEMLGSGLREVSNPSEILISHKDEELSGTALPLP
jgi:DNA repair protein RadA/Sms